ncbi:transcription initiation factor IIE beta subunit (TFIIE-BETA) [Blumeria hordei DH14]|uniref:Transcription initiation factor IIE beta subunit (TFIIE-BETA) n=1 Tax=Blumeria graminis f. sp. hordei (strain DH14) TaxID=546991 RepID=N1J9R0_BLUG1|nr:transcription initiation factor IIE beta subunit (TFIIE-BETA) [Blumeria hordei DH14]
MSSHLERLQSGFRSDVKSSASKVAVKRSAPQPPKAATTTSNTTKSDNKDSKRKREPANIVYSQPAATGYGTEAFTQVTYVIEFLKKKDERKTFQEILQYLSQVNTDELKKKLIAKILRQHDRVRWIPDPKLKAQSWDSGYFEHRPIIQVKNEIDLITYLQKKTTAQGVSVKDLKDGWPDCDVAIDKLEKEHRILVTRTKKDNHARMVWSNDPTLLYEIDPEFQVMWHKIELPSVDELVRKLLEAGQKPASEDPSKRVKLAPKPKEKKKRAPRSGGKTTNTHMAVRNLHDLSFSRLTRYAAFAQGFLTPQALVTNLNFFLNGVSTSKNFGYGLGGGRYGIHEVHLDLLAH